MDILDIDFETYSDCDIKTAGAYNYSLDPSTEILIMAYSINEGPVKILKTTQLTPELEQAFKTHHIRAWNANFERLILTNVCTPKYSWPEIPTHRFIDAMAVSSRFGYPLSLDATCKALNITEAKMKEGKALIKMFCIPPRVTPEEQPEKWETFCQYNIFDVKSQLEILNKLPRKVLQKQEQNHWELDSVINDRGVEVDIEMAKAAIEIDTQIKKEAITQIKELTNNEITTPGQIKRIVNYINKHSNLNVDNLIINN